MTAAAEKLKSRSFTVSHRERAVVNEQEVAGILIGQNE
jgi:hypothetical protein